MTGDDWKAAPWPGRHVNPDDSTATIDLEAANPDEFPAALDRHGITGHECEPGYWHRFPIWRYTGTLTALADFLAEQYEDGSGEGAWALLARLVEGEAA